MSHADSDLLNSIVSNSDGYLRYGKALSRLEAPVGVERWAWGEIRQWSLHLVVRYPAAAYGECWAAENDGKGE